MILTTILLITFIVLMVTTVIALSVGGAAFILVFGDVIVCMAIIIWIVKRLIKRKK
jgi:hypothetical protein